MDTETDGIAAENMEVQGEDDVSTLDEEVDTIVDTEPVQEDLPTSESLVNEMEDSQPASEVSESVTQTDQEENAVAKAPETATSENAESQLGDEARSDKGVPEDVPEDVVTRVTSDSVGEKNSLEESLDVGHTGVTESAEDPIEDKTSSGPTFVSDDDRFREAPHDREIDVPSSRVPQTDDFEIDPVTSVKAKAKAKVKRKREILPVDDTLKEMWKLPFELGWGREIVFRSTTVEGKRVGDVYYFSPEGKKFRSTKEIEKHLLENQCTISLDCFTFRKQPVFKEPFEIIRNAKNPRGFGSPSTTESPERLVPIEKPLSGKKKKGPSGLVKEGKPAGLKIKFPKASFSPHTSKFKASKSPVLAKHEPALKSPDKKSPKFTIMRPTVKTGNVAKKHTGKRKPVAALLNGNGKKPKMSAENGQRLCDLTCGQSAPSLHCEVCMCLFHPKCVGFTARPGAKFVCQSCSDGEQPSNSSVSNQIVSTNQLSQQPRVVATSITPGPGMGTVIRLASPGGLIPPIITSPGNRQVSPVGVFATTKVKTVASPQPPPIKLNIPPNSVNPDQISGQLITLPPHVTNKLNLTKPLNLKLNGQTYNIPPKCFIATNEGVKVLLPPGSLPDNIAKGGPTSPLAMSASNNNSGGSQQLSVRPMVEPGTTDTKNASSSGVVDLTEDEKALSSQRSKSPGKRRSKLRVPQSECHFRKLHAGFDCMIHIFQYLGTTDLLRVQMVCKTWYGVAAQSCLWKTLRLRNVKVTDWEAAASYMAKQRTQALDLRIMAHPNNDPNRTWHQLHAVLGQLKCLRQIEFSQCPSSILHAVTEKLNNLQLCIAEFIVEQVQDSRESNAKLDLGKFSSLTELECLKLRGVQGLVLPAFSFSGGLQELGSLVKLKTLALTSLRDLPANEFQFLGSLTNLETLEMGDTMSWSEETFAQIGKLTKLRNLRLEAGGSLNSESLGEALKALKELSQLELINFVISEKLADSLAEMTWLKVFSVWPNKDEEIAPAVNSNLLKATCNMSSLQLLEWGVMNECTNSENESFIPLRPTSSSSGKDGSGDAAAEDVSLLTQDVSINELIKRLSTHLPDTKIRVFKVPSALIKKACPPRGQSVSPTPEVQQEAEQEAEPVNETE